MKIYEAPPGFVAEPVQEPLSEQEVSETIFKMGITLRDYRAFDAQIRFARAIERAHGIGGKAPCAAARCNYPQGECLGICK